jgi:16S rRNA (guanine966-N2)-methyltransferase
MRIVGGALKGRSLAAPKDTRIRPTTDRTRESLFNILAHAEAIETDFEELRVLDLFAGTGALGFEALSRGAAFALFVDDHPASRGLIRENADTLGLMGCSKIYRRDATKLGSRPGSVGPAFHIVFADPPYGQGLGEKALIGALEGDWLAPGALIVLEEAKRADFTPPAAFTLLDRRDYGDTSLFFLRAPLDLGSGD